MRRKIYLIGLDGFNPDLFKVLAREGAIPNLSKLIGDGVCGPLYSTRPPYTGPAWVTMFTGVNPGRHGIYGFTGWKPGTYDRFLRNASHIGAPRLWNRLNRAGLSAGVLNVPFTYPPERIDGFMVSGMLTPSGSERYTEPVSIREIIGRVAKDYLTDIPMVMEKDWHSLDICRRLKQNLSDREAILTSLLDRWDPDFLMTVFVLPDRLQHLWYRIIMKKDGWPADNFSHEVRQRILELFIQLDGVIGRLAERLGEDDLFMIASDHGFTSFRRTFCLNSWLSLSGYLGLKKGGGMVSTISGLLNRTGIKRWLPRSLVCAARDRSMKDITEWSATRAFASAAMEEGIFINLRGREPGGIVNPGNDYDMLRREIRDDLLRLRAPGKVLNDVFFREDIYRGRYTEFAPDLLLDFSGDGWNMSTGLTGRELFRSYEDLPYGTHHPCGIWALSGRSVKSSPDPVPARIEDITPTILSNFGLPLPETLDGKPIREVVSPLFSSGIEAFNEDISPHLKIGYSLEEQAGIEQRLKGMGYL